MGSEMCIRDRFPPCQIVIPSEGGSMLMANSGLMCRRSRGISTDVKRMQRNAVNHYAEIPRPRRRLHTLFDTGATPPPLGMTI